MGAETNIDLANVFQRCDRLRQMAATQALVTRFAPSPTGFLHLGHAASAIFVWGIARRIGASIILRIEDHDRTRSKREYESAIIADLDWLGFNPDLGPRSPSTPSAFRQSDAYDTYIDALRHLEQRHLIYACDCSRKDLREQDGFDARHREPCYAGTCRDKNLPAALGHGLRVKLDKKDIAFTDLWLGDQNQCAAEQCGDLLLRDRHGNWTYQFAVVVDDIQQGVNVVIRGQDLTASTGRQIQLAQLLGRHTSIVFGHHPLIHEADGETKLSKRQYSRSLASLRRIGWTPQRVLGEAAHLVGLVASNRPLHLNDLLEVFCNG